MEFERPKRIKRQLDIAPLIDIVFQLLLFFMLTSNFMVERGFKLNLPAAVTGAPQQEKYPVMLYIDARQRVFLDRTQVQLGELTRIIGAKMQAGHSRTIVLKADETVPMGFVVQVMDSARQAKGEKLIVSTKRYEETAAR